VPISHNRSSLFTSINMTSHLQINDWKQNQLKGLVKELQNPVIQKT